MKSYIILSMCLTYILSFFIESTVLNYTLLFLTILVFVVSVRDARTLPRIFSLLMISVGTYLTVQTGKGIEGWMSGITANVSLLTLLILVPLISIPLKLGGYFEHIYSLMNRLAKEPKRLFRSLTSFIFVLGPILSLGTIRLLHEIMSSLPLRSKLLAKAYLTGFSTVILWSPYFASVALVLFYLDLSVISYLKLSFPFAILMLVVGHILFGLTIRNEPITNESVDFIDRDDSYSRRKITSLFLITAMLMITVLTFEWLLGWPMMLLVSLVALIYPTLWGIVTKRLQSVFQSFKEFKNLSVPKMGNEIVMFISAGLFGKSLTGTSFSQQLDYLMITISGQSFLLFVIVTICTVVLLTIAGLHPIVIVIPILSQLDPEKVGTTPEVIALIFMLSWAISAVFSPVNPLNLLVSGLVKKTSIQVGMKWNGLYMLIMFLLGTVYIWLMK